MNEPVAFQNVDYIRSGSYTKKLYEFPSLRAQLWDKLRHSQFEDVFIKENLHFTDIIRLINVDAYFSLLGIPQPIDENGIAHYLQEDGIIAKLDNGLYAITNLGALLFAKDLNEFSRLGRKALRVVQYAGVNRLAIQKEETFSTGYAVGFENAVRYVSALLPSEEDISAIQLTMQNKFPIPVIREAIANALIHQDFFISGAGPMVEIFENRIEVTNPGIPLVDIRGLSIIRPSHATKNLLH